MSNNLELILNEIQICIRNNNYIDDILKKYVKCEGTKCTFKLKLINKNNIFYVDKDSSLHTFLKEIVDYLCTLKNSDGKQMYDKIGNYDFDVGTLVNQNAVNEKTDYEKVWNNLDIVLDKNKIHQIFTFGSKEEPEYGLPEDKTVKILFNESIEIDIRVGTAYKRTNRKPVINIATIINNTQIGISGDIIRGIESIFDNFIK